MSKDPRTECEFIGSHLMNGSICDRCGWTSPAPDNKPTLHDVVTGTPVGQTAAQAALDASMEVQRAVGGGGGLEDILSKFGVAYANIYNGTDVHSTFAEIKTEALAAIAAYYEGLLPDEDTRKHAIEGADEFIQIGFNMAIDTIRRNFKGQPNKEESL